MPIMSSLESSFCRSSPWQAFARRSVLPWALQGNVLAGAVLELGAGGGAMAKSAALAFPQARLTITDLDPAMVRSARKRLSGVPNIEVVRADITDLSFDDASFDMVTSYLMLHHVIDWRVALDEAKRVLKPGGLLLGYDLERSRAAEAIHVLDRSPHLLIDGEMLSAQLEVSGFEAVTVQRRWNRHVMRFKATAPTVGTAG